MKLSFDADSHTYTANGKDVPSVTGILKAIGLAKDYSGLDSFYRDRGTAVAKAIELFLREALDEKSLDPVIVPYFDGFRRYWDKHSANPTHIEEPRLNEHYWYAGTPDLITANKVIDWKCSKDHDSIAELQGEGYKLFVPYVIPFDVVQFPGDGSFKIFEYGDKSDTWPSVMKCFEWWRKAHPRTKVKEIV